MPERKACPDCGSNLGPSAVKCRCGWKSTGWAEQPIQRAECAHAPHCTYPALFRRKMPTGWANLCQMHAERHDTATAKAWCQERGLDTREKQIAFWREQVKLLNQPKDKRAWMNNPKSELARKWADELLMTQSVREPGEDDEERIAA